MLRVRTRLKKFSPSICIFTVCVTAAFFLFWRNKNQPIVLPADAVQMVPELMEHMQWSDMEKVLDYGSGRGEVGYHLILPKLKKYNSQMYSVEYQRSNVKYAMENFWDPRVKYAVGNIYSDHRTEFPFWNFKFDKIFAIYMFHLVPNLEKLLTRLRDILRPGGQLGFTTLTANNVMFRLNWRLSESSKWQYHMRRYQEKYHPSWSNIILKRGENPETELKSLFERSGFRVVYLKFGTTKFTSSSVAGVLDPLMWLTPAYEDIPQTRIMDLKQDIRKQFLNMTGLSPDARNFDLENEYILGVLERI